MSRDKQTEIVEMSKVVDEALTHNVSWNSKNGIIGFSAEGIARELIDEDYRKQSDVAREIFEEIESNISPMLGLEDEKEYVAVLNTTFAELRKKYEKRGSGR